MKLIVGLGNPGKDYEKSRHNIGFMVIDHLQVFFRSEPFKNEKKFSAQISKGEYQGLKIILAKPQTFMNLSGEAVQKIADFFKIESGDIIVVYDDLDLPVGKIRVRTAGGPGTHNGMKSVVSHIGNNFKRIRVGIEGREESSKDPEKTAAYVLGRFSAAESKIIGDSIQNASEAVKLLAADNTDEAMNRFN